MTEVVCIRPSSLSLDDKYGLINYVAATTLKTVSENKDLYVRLALTKGDWRAFKDLVDDADRRGGGKEASDGTNIHAVFANLHAGYDIDLVPEPAKSDGQAAWDLLDSMGLDILHSEIFMYCPGLSEPCAGTADIVARSRRTGQCFIVDLKSVGAEKDPKYSAIDWGIQTSIYAHGYPYREAYRRDRWGRPVLDPEEADAWMPGMEPSRDYSLVVQIVRGEARAIPHWIDLKEGWKMAHVAMGLRHARKSGGMLISEAPEWL